MLFRRYDAGGGPEWNWSLHPHTALLLQERWEQYQVQLVRLAWRWRN